MYVDMWNGKIMLSDDTWWENPLVMTEFLASSHMSQLESFQTWAAMLYSSISGSLVKWNCSGSSVESEMLRPRAR